MTRFARAKGSKSSNERLPDEPTPWHVMKQQLEEALQKEEARDQTKTKSASQLLKEKDDEVYYSKSLGNLNYDWAEFEGNNNKKNNGVNTKIEKKTKVEKKKLKKAAKLVAEDSKSSEIVKEGAPKKGNKQIKQEIKSKTNDNNDQTQKSVQVDSTSSKTKTQKKVKDGSPKKANVQIKQEVKSEPSNNGKETPKSVQVDSTNAKKKKKAKNKNNKKETQTESENTSVKTEKQLEPNNVLSKRQKRNQKKQNEKNAERKESKNVNTFNTDGNTWNSSVNCDRKRKFEGEQNEGEKDGSPPKKDFRRWADLTLEEKNFRRFGNNVPKKFQKKTAKPRDDRDHQRRKPEDGSTKLTINGVDVEIVRYDGFFVRKEDAERLKELRQKMVLKAIPKSEINAAMKLERRKCEKVLARIRRQVCFHCRKAGHNLSDCPELGKEEAGTGICFKCGSTEHTHFECKVTKSDDYRYAKCFICREQGHIAKQCPDNPKGLYPDGGSCKICGDVTHLKKDCPDLVKEKEETTITLGTINDSNLEEIDRKSTHAKVEKVANKKVVKF